MRKNPFWHLKGFEEGRVTYTCSHKVRDVHKLERSSLVSQVGVAVLDGKIVARVVHQVGISMSLSMFRSYLPELKPTTVSLLMCWHKFVRNCLAFLS